MLVVESAQLDGVTFGEVSKQNMLDIDEIVQKNRANVSFDQWTNPAFAALIGALYEPDKIGEFNKYWYDALVFGNAEQLVYDQERNLQKAENSLQYIIEISNAERSDNLAKSFREAGSAYRQRTTDSKKYIAILANLIVALDSDISRLNENCERASTKIENTTSFLNTCAREASDIDDVWKQRILETIEEECESFTTRLRSSRVDQTRVLKENVLRCLQPVPEGLVRDDVNLRTSPQLLAYTKACSDHSDAIGLWNALLIVSCVSGSLKTNK